MWIILFDGRPLQIHCNSEPRINSGCDAPASICKIFEKNSFINGKPNAAIMHRDSLQQESYQLWEENFQLPVLSNGRTMDIGKPHFDVFSLIGSWRGKHCMISKTLNKHN
jgi:hypothetical protein